MYHKVVKFSTFFTVFFNFLGVCVPFGSKNELPLPSDMFKIIAIMFLGIAIGYLVRNVRGVQAVGTTTMITIVALLFVLGGEIGANEMVMRNLAGLGGEALIIAVAATLGSLVAARIIYKLFFKREGDDER